MGPNVNVITKTLRSNKLSILQLSLASSYPLHSRRSSASKVPTWRPPFRLGFLSGIIIVNATPTIFLRATLRFRRTAEQLSEGPRCSSYDIGAYSKRRQGQETERLPLRDTKRDKIKGREEKEGKGRQAEEGSRRATNVNGIQPFWEGWGWSPIQR